MKGEIVKKICFITSTRAEYGALKWLMKGIDILQDFQSQLIVTGAHLMLEQGNTINEIIMDGFIPDRRVDACIDTKTKQSIAASMGRLGEKISIALAELTPDFVVVIGDRYELLPICSSAFVMQIPLIHISGGDVTEGAIDDGIRNAITMLATYHFPSTADSERNIIRMRGSNCNVWSVGVPELDAVNHEKLMTREDLARDIDLDIYKDWVLMTYHAETVEEMKHNIDTLNNIFCALKSFKGFQIVATYSNADFGGTFLNKILQEEAKANPNSIKVIPSLGHKRYLSFIRQAKFVIGNSSSGITQTPMLRIPAVNIGIRQKGRYQCSNVIQCGYEYMDIRRSIEKAMRMNSFGNDLDYWGDGHASEKILKILSEKI